MNTNLNLQVGLEAAWEEESGVESVEAWEEGSVEAWEAGLAARTSKINMY